LSYKEAQELQGLPARIDALEREQAQLGQQLADPALYRGEADAVRAAKDRYAEIERLLAQAIERWTELEERSAKSS
jgi:ATP-binding cassette subfamily F protein uup